MKKIILFAVLITSLASCIKGKNEVICGYDQCQLVAPATEIQSVQNYLNTNSITATQHCSGIFYVVHQQGTGAGPTACGAAQVKYKGTLTNGTVFDENQPNQTPVFNMQTLIPGFKNGLLQLKSGGKMTMYIPPFLGYGSSQNGSIPGNSILIFEVELIAAQ
jgi:FKBP-type peptidyl-prolyl cis-trans isomerase FkpA